MWRERHLINPFPSKINSSISNPLWIRLYKMITLGKNHAEPISYLLVYPIRADMVIVPMAHPSQLMAFESPLRLKKAFPHQRKSTRLTTTMVRICLLASSRIHFVQAKRKKKNMKSACVGSCCRVRQHVYCSEAFKELAHTLSTSKRFIKYYNLEIIYQML